MIKIRSSKKELLDGDSIPQQDLFRNLKELDIINHLLGGYTISYSALKKILTESKEYTFVDIGCGGGDTLKRISNWQKKSKINIKLYGIDIKPVCIEYANQNNHQAIQFICDDYKNTNRHLQQIDIIHACLFCHHLSENEILELIQFAQKNKAILIINDLERNLIAYYAIKVLTAIFSKSYLVKNDAPLSVLRGFKKKEWLDLILKSGVKKYSVKNKWAFRHQVIVYGNEQ
jgi:2-polyprenyl-3-methyl-5-hydroxy-6-metoxy-1,4-benzoquinol methylase